jgi:hypothetical protein
MLVSGGEERYRGTYSPLKLDLRILLGQCHLGLMRWVGLRLLLRSSLAGVQYSEFSDGERRCSMVGDGPLYSPDRVACEQVVVPTGNPKKLESYLISEKLSANTLWGVWYGEYGE